MMLGALPALRQARGRVQGWRIGPFPLLGDLRSVRLSAGPARIKDMAVKLWNEAKPAPKPPTKARRK
jgi:hypothetical protein